MGRGLGRGLGRGRELGLGLGRGLGRGRARGGGRGLGHELRLGRGNGYPFIAHFEGWPICARVASYLLRNLNDGPTNILAVSDFTHALRFCGYAADDDEAECLLATVIAQVCPSSTHKSRRGPSRWLTVAGPARMR